MVKIPVGSIEEVLVNVVDKTAQITDLATATCTFDVFDSNGQTKYNDEPVASVDGMTLFCKIDTTHGGEWAPGRYRLFATVTLATEAPRLGPFDFDVV